jgi:prevent-host-death family protein
MLPLESTMTITVPELSARLQEIVDEVEREGHVVEVERDGQVVARIVPAASSAARKAEVAAALARLRGSGVLLASPEESVWFDSTGDKR